MSALQIIFVQKNENNLKKVLIRFIGVKASIVFLVSLMNILFVLLQKIPCSENVQ